MKSLKSSTKTKKYILLLTPRLFSNVKCVWKLENVLPNSVYRVTSGLFQLYRMGERWHSASDGKEEMWDAHKHPAPLRHHIEREMCVPLWSTALCSGACAVFLGLCWMITDTHSVGAAEVYTQAHTHTQCLDTPGIRQYP